MNEAPADAPLDPARLARAALRRRLLAERDAFAPPGPAAEALAAALCEAVAEVEPTVLGIYLPLRSEFNAAGALVADPRCAALPLALPYARRTPPSLEFRRWAPGAPTVADEHGIASSDGVLVVPDVVVVPCVGFTVDGHRLGYGGGYYDRWLAQHPHATAIGVAWSFAEVDRATFAARVHDVPLALVVTERGVR